MVTGMEDCTFVIFGATGNLSQVKLLPALYHLDVAGRLSEGLKIVGFGRRDWDDETWCGQVRNWLADKATDPEVLERFCARLSFFRGNLGDEQIYPALRDFLLSGSRFSPHLSDDLSSSF